MGGDDHRCEWRTRAEALEAELERLTNEHRKTVEQLGAIQETVEKLQRHVFGKRSEKMPSVAQAIRDPAQTEADRIAALQTRRENAEKKRQLVTRRIEHKVPEEKKVCPKCGGRNFSKIGDGRMTELYDLIPALVEQETDQNVSCNHSVTAAVTANGTCTATTSVTTTWTNCGTCGTGDNVCAGCGSLTCNGTIQSMTRQECCGLQ